jgi:small-conductance mechanosensitive channel
VRVGEDEGVVTEVGMLSTKIATRKQEEITFPNAVLVGTTTTNYSRLAQDNGVGIGTTVTVGYDTPWRQVHALLLQAAGKTRGIRKVPEPLVLQKALSTFAVEYHLVVRLDRPEDKVLVLSELHAHIQDGFNEFGVQIMVPAFESQPAGKILVPKSEWFRAPAENNGKEQPQPTLEPTGDHQPAN